MAVKRLGVFVAVLTSFVVARSLAQQPAPWYARPMFGPGGFAFDFALADFDVDGRLDAVVAAGTDSSPYAQVSLMRGTQLGYFGPPSPIDVGLDPYYVQTRDVDHDGAPDVIASGVAPGTNNAGRLSVVLRRGPGAFRAPVVTALDVGGGRFAVGDVDEDGELDVVLGGGSRLLLGRGDGTFEPALALPFAGWWQWELLDLDGDTHLDLGAVAGSSLVAALGHGDGTFGVAVTTTVTSTTHGVGFHDFDGDGICEALTTRSTPTTPGAAYSYVELRAGLGGGAFGRAVSLWSGPLAGAVALGDVDGDGRVDAGVPHSFGYFGTDASGVEWLRNLGGLAFAPAVEIRCGGSTLSARWADLEGDGDVDLVTLNDYSKTELGTVHALRPGVFERGPKLLDSVGEPFSVAVGDLDGDGATDVAAADYDLPMVELWRGTGDGDFVPLPALVGGVPLQKVVLADFNHDARADVAAIGAAGWSAPGELWVWVSSGSGYAAPYVLALGNGGSNLAAGDLDGDGRADLAVSTDNVVRVLHSRLDGTFEQVSTVTMGSVSTSLIGSLFIGDYDGDGRADLAQVPHEEWVWVAHGTGAGHFAAPVPTEIEEHIGLLASGDLDLDGRDDLIVAEYDLDPGRLYALWGRSDRTFDVESFISLYIASSAVIADFNGNGCPDVGATDGGSMQVLTGDCHRTFDPPRGFGLAQGANATVVADFDRDGRIDIASALTWERRIAVLLHD